MLTGTNQSGATAGGDVVGRDKIVKYNLAPAGTVGKLEALKACLEEEMKNNKTVAEIVESLQQYHSRRPPPDGISGLECKLRVGKREPEILDAMEQKEIFAKLLERWSLYASAQEIIAHLLSRVVHEFRQFIQPQLGQIAPDSYNLLVTERIVYPIVDEVGIGAFSVNHQIVMGMFYWLAEQCYVRWHK
jgi:hypothetical protein